MAERYKIYEKLGAGGVGAVFRAYDNELKRWVAIKRLISASDASKDADSTAELRREANALASLRNPNIVSIFDVSTDAEGLFMVMELVEGEDLADVVTRGPLEYDDFKELASQTLEGLLAAHQRHIQHRDIKPENIKVERLPGGRLQSKIIDFGLARSGLSARKQTEDQEGTVMGSIYYMAPEQLTREPVDERTDLYALGCVFYESLSGRKAFDGDSMGAVIDKHVNHDIVPLDVIAPHVPPWLGAWVLRLMAHKPEDRPQNAQQAIEEFRAWEKMAASAPATWTPQAHHMIGGSGSYSQQISGAETVPLRSFFPAKPVEEVVYAEPVVEVSHVPQPVIEMGAHTTQISRPKPVSHARPPVTGKQTVRYVPSRRGSQRLHHDEPGEKRPFDAKPFLLIGGALAFLALLAWFVFGRNPGSSTPAAVVEEDLGPALPAITYNLPRGRLAPPVEQDIAIHLTPETGVISHLTINGKPVPASINGPAIQWHDVAPLAENNILRASQDNAQFAPRFIEWPPPRNTPVGIKPDRKTLDFHPRTEGKPVGLTLDNPGREAEKFPFGSATTSEEKGLTLALVFQVDSAKLPARILSLSNQKGDAAVSLRVDQTRSVVAEYRNGNSFGSIASRDINPAMPCVAVLTWHSGSGKFELRIVDAPGKVFKASGPVVSAPTSAMHRLQLGLAQDSAQPTTAASEQFEGFLGDLILYSSALKDDQAQALTDKVLRDYYLLGPQPKPVSAATPKAAPLTAPKAVPKTAPKTK